jgi:purine-binding chemotaxis protein CheW
MEKLCLCFRLDDEWYLHDVSVIREVIPWQEPSPVPGDAPQSLGILDIRGNIISLFSGRTLLSLDPAEDVTQGKAIIFETEQGNYGVLVDEVAEIISVDCNSVVHPMESKQNRVIQGTVNHDGKLLILLDFTRCEAITIDI